MPDRGYDAITAFLPCNRRGVPNPADAPRPAIACQSRSLLSRVGSRSPLADRPPSRVARPLDRSHTSGRYPDCMRSHGVPDFPDPTANGEYILPPQIDVSSPTFKSAQPSVHEIRPRPGKDLVFVVPAPDARQARVCMRAQHITNFPDPAGTPLATLQLILSSGINPQTPAFQHAAAACGAPQLPRGLTQLLDNQLTSTAAPG